MIAEATLILVSQVSPFQLRTGEFFIFLQQKWCVEDPCISGPGEKPCGGVQKGLADDNLVKDIPLRLVFQSSPFFLLPPESGVVERIWVPGDVTPGTQISAQTFIPGLVVKVAHDDDAGMVIFLPEIVNLGAESFGGFLPHGAGFHHTSVPRRPVVEKDMEGIFPCQDPAEVEDFTGVGDGVPVGDRRKITVEEGIKNGRTVNSGHVDTPFIGRILVDDIEIPGFQERMADQFFQDHSVFGFAKADDRRGSQLPVLAITFDSAVSFS